MSCPTSPASLQALTAYGAPDARTLEATTGTGATSTVRADDFGAGPFRLSQIVSSTTGDARRERVTLELSSNRRTTLLENVSLLCLQRLFQRARLGRPIIIGRDESVQMSHTNDAVDTAFTRLTLIGAGDPPEAGAPEASGDDDGPAPVLLYVRQEIAANAEMVPVRFLDRGYSMVARRIAAATETAAGDASLTMTLRDSLRDRLPSLTPDQLAQLFDGASAEIPLDGARPAALYVTNPLATPQTLSVLVEAYPA